MLCMSAAVIFTCTLKANAKKFKYPKINCEKVAEGYAGKMDFWEQDSGNEYIINKQKEDNGDPTNYQGNMQCFCQELANNNS